VYCCLKRSSSPEGEKGCKKEREMRADFGENKREKRGREHGPIGGKEGNVQKVV